MPEELIVRHCSPTLAGMKTGNLFTCHYPSMEEVIMDIRQWNRRLVPLGLRILPLRFDRSRALIYLYRPERLRRDLGDKNVEHLLKIRGYSPENPERCITQLIRRFHVCPEFPHEIGLFLSYPPEDVEGFMENRAAKSKCVGCWKVYGNEKESQKLFARYQKCTSVYISQWTGGKPLESLIVGASNHDRKG